MTEITREQFAKWSFERDRDVGLYPRIKRWERLAGEEKDVYYQEAEHYLRLPRTDWPQDILERL